MKNFFNNLLDYAMTAVVVIIILIAFFLICLDSTKTEVERYSVGCEITQMAYAEETVTRNTSKPVYKMGVRCDDFAATLDITDAQFAQFVVGDVVEVEAVVYEYYSGVIQAEYRLLGMVKNN